MQIRCPRCSTPLASRQGGRLKIRLPMLSFRKSGDGHVCETVCPGCRYDIELPLQLSDERLAKSLTDPSEIKKPRGQ